MILEKRQTLLKTEKIVVIEDEDDILEVIAYNLKREGYEVITSTSGEDGLEKIEKSSPQLVVLDLMLPEIDGLELCRKLKSDPLTRSIPVIMVTAKGEESDVVLGLGVGADDYVTKPFSPRELVARVKAVLRRSRARPEGDSRERIARGGVVIDPQRHDVQVDGEPVLLTATEFRLLHFLATHPGRVFTRDHLLTRVIGEDAIVIDRNIDVHVRAIRKKLGAHRELIETIRGVGYRFKDKD
ncbi:MAG: response regulator [Candidatus Krumholzibacteria bacterium]|nr:response regulator [Candidatus Krumholzibacteria bacterium]MDH4335826.1 response regulator [Candidatus Krumholzibacteria bacterium]MDH5269352.1 response regulator [Candidatus Krumholzibacteria bacterium]